MNILCINCGSSSLKFDVRRLTNGQSGHSEVLARGEVERIGHQDSLVWLERGGKRDEHPVSAQDHGAAVDASLGLLQDAGLLSSLDGAGVRVVHGGLKLLAPTRIDDKTLAAIREATELAPLHNGPALAAIEAVTRRLTRVPLVATFDTAFFAGLPDVAREYALPRDVRQQLGLRRFGFHGLAHRYMAEEYARLHPQAKAPRLITLQLGSGCSAAAIADGRPLDTSMGFTPLEGLIMGTRSGDLDPAIPLLIAKQMHLTPGDVETMLNQRSGLLGLSNRSNDMKDLLQAASNGDPDADLAVRSFCYQVQKYIGAYLAVLRGADAVVFGGGIGERSPEVRQRICDGMDWAGLTLEADANCALGEQGGRISKSGSAIEVMVVPVDEAEIIAHDTVLVLQA